MAIQRGIALSAFSDTTAGLTLSQARLSSWIAAAERVCACGHSCTAGEERRLGPTARVCVHYGQKGPALAWIDAIHGFAKCLTSTSLRPDR